MARLVNKTPYQIPKVVKAAEGKENNLGAVALAVTEKPSIPHDEN